MCLAVQVLPWQRSFVFSSLDSKSRIKRSLAIFSFRWLIWWTILCFFDEKEQFSLFWPIELKIASEEGALSGA